MAANLLPITSDGGFTSGGNINSSGDSSASPSLNDFFSITSAANFAIVTDNANTDQTWTFDDTGNLTLPGNTFAVNYANGTQVSIGGGGANTGNVTFDDQVVVGTGDGSGGGGLYLAPGTESVANLQYWRVRGGDVATHMHLDTGNNAYFDQYFGDDIKYVKLEAAGNVQIGSNDDTGNSASWTFGVDGNLTLPQGTTISDATDIVTVTLDQFTDGGYPGTQVFTKVSDTLYELSPGGPYMTLISGIWYLKISVSTYYNSTDLITWEAVAGGLPAPVGTLTTVARMNLGVDGNVWNFSGDGSLTLPTGVSIDYNGNVQYPRIIADSGKLFSVQGQGNSGSAALAWTVDPDAASQYAAVSVSRGGGDNLAKVILQAQSDSGNVATAKTWTFNENGNLTLPGNLVIAGNANVFGIDAALIQQNDGLPIVISSSGANGAVATYWVEDVGNVGTSNIAAVYVRPTLGANIVRIAVGQNGNAGPNLWDFGTTGNLSAPGAISAVGNVTGAYILGNGSQLTSLPAPTVAQDITSNGAMSIMTYDGNIKYVNYATVEPASGNITGGNILTGAQVIANGVIQTGTGFSTGGYLSVSGNSDLHNTTVTGNISATGNVIGGNILTAGLISATSTITSSANIVGGNIRTAGLMTATGNINGGNITTAGLISATSTITSAANVVGGNISTAGLVTATGNVIGGNIRTVGLISATGNVTGGNITTAGLISATGAITGAALTGTSLTVSTGNITGGNLLLSGAITDSGQLDIQTSASNANIVLTPNGTGNVNTGANVSVTGNVQAGNVRTAGVLSATGNVTGNFILGNGSQLTGIVASSGNSIINGNSNVVVSANSNVTVGVSGTAAVATFATTGEYVTGVISATGSITGGNVLTGGLISATGNVIGNNIISNNINGTNPNISLVATSSTWTFDNTGNLTLPGNTININYANTTAVPFIGVPSWTDGGNVTFSGTGNDPTFPTSGVVYNKIYYRQIGPKTWQVNGKYQTASASGGNEGIGDYIVRLPASLQFDTTLATQAVYTTSLGTSAAWTYVAIPESNGRYFYGLTSEGGWDGGVVPYSSTAYRLVTGSNAGSTYQPWGQNFAPVTLVNLAIVWSFTFQAA